MVIAADFKVGFVNVGTVLKTAPQMEEAQARMEKEFAPRERELVSLQKENRKLENQLVRDSEIMSEKERGRFERDLRSRKREVKRLQDEFREDISLRRNQEQRKINKTVMEAIQVLAKNEKYDLIVGDGVIFASKRVDITSKVVKQLKKSHKGKSAKKPKKPAK